MDTDPVRLERKGGLTVLTLDSPPHNLFDRAMIEAVSAAVDDLRRNTPRAVLIRAEGPVVSGGIDVNLFAGLGSRRARELLTEMFSITHRIENLPAPVLFAAHGTTLTAAFEIALACDLILAGRSARFGLVEAVVGVSPGMGGTQRLAQAAGPKRAADLVMTGELISAARLADWGVVNRLFEDDGFEAESLAFAEAIAEGPTLAHSVTKEIIKAWQDGGLALADRETPDRVAALFDTTDSRDAIDHFLTGNRGQVTYKGV